MLVTDAPNVARKMFDEARVDFDYPKQRVFCDDRLLASRPPDSDRLEFKIATLSSSSLDFWGGTLEHRIARLRNAIVIAKNSDHANGCNLQVEVQRAIGRRSETRNLRSQSNGDRTPKTLSAQILPIKVSVIGCDR